MEQKLFGLKSYNTQKKNEERKSEVAFTEDERISVGRHAIAVAAVAADDAAVVVHCCKCENSCSARQIEDNGFGCRCTFK